MAEGFERRDFLKVLGVAGAGGLVGCGTRQAEKIIPYVVPEEEIVPGLSTWYRTTCRECPAGCGMQIRTREGRALKAEGSPLSPIAHGRLCARGQASLHGLYDPDRIQGPRARGAEGEWQSMEWEEAEQRLATALAAAGGRAALLSYPVTGSMDRLLDEWSQAMGVARVRYEPVGWEPIRAASQRLFGVDGIPFHDFGQAEVVATFGADFLETWISPVDYHHGFVEARAYANGSRGRLIAVCAHQSLTGMNADDWLPARPGTEHLVALAMARVIADAGWGDAGQAAGLLQRVDVAAAAEAAGVPLERIHQAARAFANNGRSLGVGPGLAATHHAATGVAAAVAVLNAVAGNLGSTVRYDRLEQPGPGGSYAGLQDLLARIRAGEIEALLVYGPNPAFSLPARDEVLATLDAVPFVASFSTFLDETAERAHLLLPDHHFLESWGDHEPRTGVHALVQPVMVPVFDTRQTGDVLLSVADRAGVSLPRPAERFYDYLRARWAEELHPRLGAGQEFEAWWRASLQNGVVEEDVPTVQVALDPAGLADLPLDVPRFTGQDADPVLVVYPSLRFYDGRLANRMWLQELADPVNKTTWISVAELNPATARRLGVETGSIVELETTYGTVRLPVWVHPGMREDVVAIQLGQGHEAMGRFARDRGVNVAALLGDEVDADSGALAWIQTRARVRPTRDWQRLPMTSGSDTQAGRDVAQAMTLAEAEVAEPVPPFPEERRIMVGHHVVGHPNELTALMLQRAGGFAPDSVPAGPGDWPPPWVDFGEYALEQPRWGMAIDLERCTGCSACVTACYAENNIGVVGPDNVTKGRIQHWIRIERFFETDAEGETSTRFLPVMCQHCATAPCEPVCPVYAAYHTPDGLNAQVYNRCVGTRYCANNCPYKVRYFNWFTWEWPEPLNWQLNPDVTVREKGVMEKCTFCVQRIREREHHAKLEGRAVMDGEIVPACAQSCPGDAIVFGNMKDPQSRAAQLAASGRGYRVLEDLNTQSAITYLKQVTVERAEV